MRHLALLPSRLMVLSTGAGQCKVLMRPFTVFYIPILGTKPLTIFTSHHYIYIYIYITQHHVNRSSCTSLARQSKCLPVEECDTLHPEMSVHISLDCRGRVTGGTVMTGLVAQCIHILVIAPQYWGTTNKKCLNWLFLWYKPCLFAPKSHVGLARHCW